MARVVDKEQKRKDIALACKDVVLSNSINSLTVASLAKAAGIGKGTVYEYFNSKEEIVFEIVTVMIQEQREKLAKELESVVSTRDKIKKFSEFFYHEDDLELRELYKEFTSISLMDPTPEMLDFQTQCMDTYYEWFKTILQAGIDKGELREDALQLARGLFVVGKGMFIIHNTTNAIESLEGEFNHFIDSLFEILEVK